MENDPFDYNDLDTGRSPGGALFGIVACAVSATLVGFVLVVLSKAAFG